MAQAAESSIQMMKTELIRRLETDNKYEAAKQRLEELNRDHFYLRYGDYFAVACSNLRKSLRSEIAASKKRAKDEKRRARRAERTKHISTIPQSTSPDLPSSDSLSPYPSSANPKFGKEIVETFLLGTWSETNDTLQKEQNSINLWYEENERGPWPTTPMSDLVTELAEGATNIGFQVAKTSIKFYAERNQMAHSHIMAMARERDITKVSAQLQADLNNLAFTPYMGIREKAAAKAAIFATVGRFLKGFEYDEAKGKIRKLEFWPMDEARKFIRNGTPEQPNPEKKRRRKEQKKTDAATVKKAPDSIDEDVLDGASFGFCLTTGRSE